MAASHRTDLDRSAGAGGSSKQKFQCPICRADGFDANSEVAYTRMNATRDKITRRRRCVQNAKHTFTTEESTRAAGTVEMWIRRSTDSKIESRFSSTRLQRDIRRASLGRIEDADLARVISEVTATLSERMSELGEPLNAEERSEHSSTLGAVAVWDVTIMEEVERTLNDTKTRIPHVLYALGVRGQVNLAHRSTRHTGFIDATAFLRWLFSGENYPRLARTLPAPKVQRSETWWSPTNLRHPDMVIKRSGDQRKFDYEQFHKSISSAMLGRSRWVLESKEVANWVLVQIEGQRRVTSSHLAALVSTALRRTDDIAYLRWAIVEKRFSSVAEIADEAEDLIAHPSVRLRFAPQGQPRTDAAAPSVALNDSTLVARLRSLIDEIELS